MDKDRRHPTAFYGTDCKIRYTRLNYGTISAQDIFDKAMDDTIAGLNSVLHIRDDFTVFGKATRTMTRPLRTYSADFQNAASLSTLKNACSAYLR